MERLSSHPNSSSFPMRVSIKFVLFVLMEQKQKIIFIKNKNDINTRN